MQGKLAPCFRKEPVRRRRRDEVQGVRQIREKEPHDLGREIPDETDPHVIARSQEQAQHIHDVSSAHSGQGNRAVPPEASERVAEVVVRFQQGHGGEDPEEHGRGLIDGEGHEQGQDRPRRQQPPRTAARLERPLAQHEGEAGGERGEGKRCALGPGRPDLEGKGGAHDHGHAQALEAAPAGECQRPEHAVRQQGDAEHPHDPRVAQVLDVRHPLQSEDHDQGPDRTALQVRPLDLPSLRPFDETGIVTPVAVIVGDHGREAGQEDRQEEAGDEQIRDVWSSRIGMPRVAHHVGSLACVSSTLVRA